MPKVSICLPTYNGEKFLIEALDSILSQTYKDFEVIVCDDASKDKTPEIISQYVDKSSKISYFPNTRNLGIFQNWNKCIEHSSGEYLTVFGQDDVMLPRNLEVQVNILDLHPDVGLVVPGVNIIDGRSQEIEFWACSENKLEKGREWLLRNAGWGNNVGRAPFVFLRKDALEKTGGLFNSEYVYTGDFEMWARIAVVSELYFINNEILGYYRLHGGNETYNHGHLTEIREILRSWSNVIDLLNLSSSELKELEKQALSRAVNWIFGSGMISHHLKRGNWEYALKMCHLVENWRDQDAKISFVLQWLAEGGISEITQYQQNLTEVPIFEFHQNWVESKCEAWRRTAQQAYQELNKLQAQLEHAQMKIESLKAQYNQEFFDSSSTARR